MDILTIAFSLLLAGSVAEAPLPYESAVADLKLLPAGCVPARLHVDSAAPKGGDGSAKAPFTTLREAVAAAEKLRPCALSAAIAPGKYVEGPLVMRLPTIVAGRTADVSIQGSFEVLSRTLVLTGLTLTGSPQSPRLAVLAKSKAALAFLGVQFFSPGGHAIRQHGGTLNMTDVLVKGVWTYPTEPSSGSAVHLTGGVQASLIRVRLSGNVRGLYAADAGTRVSSYYVIVENTTIHPTRLENIARAASCNALGFQYLGAVEVDSSAELLGVFWEIRRSQLAGIYAHDRGRVQLNRVEIDLTERIRAGGVECGGFGAIVHRGGAIDLTHLAITNSQLCGVVVGPAPGSAMDLHSGFIDFAPIGACVQQDGYDAERLHDRVEYRSGLGVPLRATSYSLPDL